MFAKYSKKIAKSYEEGQGYLDFIALLALSSDLIENFNNFDYFEEFKIKLTKVPSTRIIELLNAMTDFEFTLSTSEGGQETCLSIKFDPKDSKGGLLDMVPGTEAIMDIILKEAKKASKRTIKTFLKRYSGLRTGKTQFYLPPTHPEWVLKILSSKEVQVDHILTEEVSNAVFSRVEKEVNPKPSPKKGKPKGSPKNPLSNILIKTNEEFMINQESLDCFVWAQVLDPKSQTSNYRLLFIGTTKDTKFLEGQERIEYLKQRSWDDVSFEQDSCDDTFEVYGKTCYTISDKIISDMPNKPLAKKLRQILVRSKYDSSSEEESE